MPKTFSMTLAASAAFCVALGFTGCHDEGNSDPAAAGPPTARVATAQTGDIAHVLTLAGQFQPYQVVDVHPKVSGYMKKINVDIGDIVHQGETAFHFMLIEILFKGFVLFDIIGITGLYDHGHYEYPACDIFYH